jgi:hypothetical protein
MNLPALEGLELPEHMLEKVGSTRVLSQLSARIASNIIGR